MFESPDGTCLALSLSLSLSLSYLSTLEDHLRTSDNAQVSVKFSVRWLLVLEIKK